MKLSLFPPKPLSVITKIFSFLIVVFATQAKDDEYYMQCSRPCKSKTEIKYPFWKNDGPQYCGVQGYEVTCEENKQYPIFKMGTQSFDVLNINRSTRIMTIARQDLFDNILYPPNFDNLEDTAIDTTFVKYALGTENLTLFYFCSQHELDYVEEREKFKCKYTEGVTLNETSPNKYDASQLCNKSIAVRVMMDNWNKFETRTLPLQDLVNKGFEVEYQLQMEKKVKCDICETSGGICGTNNTRTSQFTCFCKDGPQPEKCKDGPQPARTKTSGVIGSLFLIIVFSCFCKVVNKEISKRRKKNFFKQNGGLLLRQQLVSSDCNVEKIKVFKSYELEIATNHYNADRVLGQGGEGTVYKGILPDGRLIAVKKSKIIDPTNVGQFVNEAVILSQINHRNIVKLLGCCLETEVPMLVYEFISNGTLYQHIHNPKEGFRFSWDMRLRIAVEIAGTLSYLHNAAPVPIYHRDIKSTNILLDDKYQAKVSDFGISRSVNIGISHLTTLVRGTFGYFDPEYFQSSRFTEKSDVYSFGVVLVELLTGQKPIFSNTSQECKGLVPHFMESMEENHFLDMIDPQLSKEGQIEEMVEVAHLAKACLNSTGKRRPTMKEATVQLEGIQISREQTMSQENDRIDQGKAYDSSTSSGVWSGSSAALSLKVDINSLLDP